MTEDYGKKGETAGVRGEKERQDLWTDTDSSSNAGRVSQGVRNQRVSFDRKSSEEGNFLGYAVGGMLDQLIDDAEKQLVKSRECIVWYREEEKEYEQKLNNFRKLKQLHEQQMAAAEAEADQQLDKVLDTAEQQLAAPEASNQNGGESLAE